VASGDRDEPFKTIVRALAAVAPGDRISIGPGTYPERVEVTASGTSGSPIVVEGTRYRWEVVEGDRSCRAPADNVGTRP